MGGEISAKSWKELRLDAACCFCLITDIAHFHKVVDAAGVTVPVAEISAASEARSVFGEALPIIHRPLGGAAKLGSFSAETAGFVMAAIQEAVALCLKGETAGIVTNPIQKEALYAAGFPFQGHTDFLGHLARQHGYEAQDVMMLVGQGLRAIPVTVHIALKDVPAALTGNSIINQARIAHDALKRYFGIARPRLAVSGLNPHAGENGSMGREEIEIIIPAIKRLREEGFEVAGPLPADTAFFPDARNAYDVILCMYHDQALIPVKTLDFHCGVNVTLGLPFIRTSPDHGTALGLAGTGKAQAQSLIAAIRLAGQMAASAS